MSYIEATKLLTDLMGGERRIKFIAAMAEVSHKSKDANGLFLEG